MQNAIAWRWSEDPEQKRWMDWKTDWTHHDEAKARGFPVEYAVALSALNESGKVYYAMLRGEIPKLTWRQMVHLSGPVPNTADEALAEITRLRGEVKGLEADIDRYISINAELATDLEESRRVLEEARRVSRELHGADRCTKCGYLFLESEHIGCIRAASERNHRFLEEALELVQACDCSREHALELVNYVYSRPVGRVTQEVGGVAITLTALCLAHGIDLEFVSEEELSRIWRHVDAIREKQKSKPRFGALPGAYP